MPDAASASPEQTTTCGLCGALLQPGVLGTQCPVCLLSLGSRVMLEGEPEPQDTDLLLGGAQVRRFGDYELLEEIASGGMGVVYRAWQVSLEREVAVKMILAGELAGKAALRMFQTEAQAAANLHHPNIVPVYEIGEREMQHYFSMRLVPGRQNIADWAKGCRGDFRSIAVAVAKVARAVAHANERGVLHRDLKPSNILWDPAGEPQVTDFGLAKIMNSRDSSLSASAILLGSPSYMAPEQTGGRVSEITTAADVYGLGAVLYELLSGRPPFLGKSVIETARLVTEAAPAPLREVPVDLATVCLKCLAKKPSDRYISAGALADDLERFSRGESVSAVPLSPVQQAWRWALRKPALATLLALFVLSCISGVSGIFWQWRKTEHARAEQAAALAHLEWQQIDRWVDDGDISRSLAFLASLIRKQPTNWQAAMYAMSIVDQHPFPILAGPVIKPPTPLSAPAQISPDGVLLAGAGEDNEVRIWSVVSGQELARFQARAPVTAMAMGQGSLLLALAMGDGALTVKASLGAEPKVLQRIGADPVKQVLFSADGGTLLARSGRRAEAWTALSGSIAPILLEFDQELAGLSVCENGRRVLAWSKQRACVWELPAARRVLEVEASAEFRSGAMAAAGNRIALLDSRIIARTWDIDSGREHPAIHSERGDWKAAALDRDGATLSAAGSSNQVYFFDVQSGFPRRVQSWHQYAVLRLASSGDGRRIFTYGLDDRVVACDATTGERIMNEIALGGVRDDAFIQTSNNGATVLIHALPDNRESETLSVWRVTPRREPALQVVSGARDLDVGGLSPDGRLGCLGLQPHKRAYLYELATGRVVLDEPVAGSVYVHLFSPDNQKYYALTANGWLYGWDLATRQPLWPPHHEPKGLIRPGAIAPDGTFIIAGHNDGSIRIYDTASGKRVGELKHPGEVKSLRFAPDRGGRFVSSSTDGQAHVWDLRAGARLSSLVGHTHTILSTAWSPDSGKIATASYDHTVRVWDADSGRQIGAVMPHPAWLSHVEFSPDGRTLATACRDGTARLWNADTGEPVSRPLTQGTTVEAVRFTRDGACLLARDHDGFRFWDTERAEPVTVHYREPVAGGIGIDSESLRSMMTPDGTRVFLSHSMNHAAWWQVEQPRTTAPQWFPELLECLALLRMNSAGMTAHTAGHQLPVLREAIAKSAPDDPYAGWARRVLGTGQGTE